MVCTHIHAEIELNEGGVTFHEEKRKGVQSFPRPEVANYLMKVVGLVQHFTSHVPHMSDRIQ